MFYLCYLTAAALLLTVSFVTVNGQPIELDSDLSLYRRKHVDYHPFPEMSRFLNSYGTIHNRPSKQTGSSIHSFLVYLCNIADDDEQIEQMLTLFGHKYRSLITEIIEQDCPIRNNNRRRKRTTNNTRNYNFPRMFLRDTRRLP